MEKDIENFINRNFKEYYKVVDQLYNENNFPKSDTDRIIRCILFLAQKNYCNINDSISLAKTDYRDLIYQAEYDCSKTKIRDLSKPFDFL